jgi:hypothetical protein
MSYKNDNKKENKTLIYNSLKIWCGLIIFVTILYFLYNYFRDDYIMEILRDHKVECLKTITPNYPPPLLNFIEPQNVLNVKSII